MKTYIVLTAEQKETLNHWINKAEELKLGVPEFEFCGYANFAGDKMYSLNEASVNVLLSIICKTLQIGFYVYDSNAGVVRKADNGACCRSLQNFLNWVL